MKNQSWSWIAVISLVSVIHCSSWAWGQNYGRPMNDVPREQWKTKGVLKNMAPGKLHVVDEDGGQWLVIVEPNAKEVGVSGSADVSWLRPGMFVEFKGTFSAKGESKSVISAATVMVPDMSNPPGVFSEIANKSNEFFATKEEKAPKEVFKGKKDDVPVDVRVVGQISRLKDGKVTINAGGTQLNVEFDEKARISVNLNGLQSLALAKPEDKVEISGWHIQGQKGQAWASKVQVSAAQSFTAAPKKPVAGPPQKPTDAAKPSE